MTEDKQNGFSFQLQRFADGGTDGGTEGQESGGKAPADASTGQEGGKPADESPKAELVDFARPLVTIPSLAIHMDRKVNEEGALNAQTDMRRSRRSSATWARTTGGRRRSAQRRRKSFPMSFRRIPLRRAVRWDSRMSSSPRRAL